MGDEVFFYFYSLSLSLSGSKHEVYSGITFVWPTESMQGIHFKDLILNKIQESGRTDLFLSVVYVLFNNFIQLHNTNLNLLISSCF